MSVYTYEGKVLTLSELPWLPVLLLPLGLGIVAAMTKQDPPVAPVGWVILFTAILGLWAIAGLYFLRKRRQQKGLRLLLQPPGLVVGWGDERYAVNGEEVNAVVADCVLKMSPEFPRAENALAGCVVWFQEPTWVQQPSAPGYLARRVAGVQDGELLLVGWNENVNKTALKHEIAHRILQVYAGDPPEVLAHLTMERLGVL